MGLLIGVILLADDDLVRVDHVRAALGGLARGHQAEGNRLLSLMLVSGIVGALRSGR